ncbi:uncharacterized protein SAPINGB_P001849 [Magnusiomyces paraingens]|uniref:Uncharacterized protein n=1 Tax=Magnusiomyces paraingens TaxID=2606893 RepID=A0A5E8BBI9_9ASCO|nr:uncharacterized protein SAPINGB_P001849 [Saprochaete ingens]VVT48581.1 unnamed protein product [Saprochaete ingens]
MSFYDTSISNWEVQRFSIQRLKIIDISPHSRINHQLFQNTKHLSLGNIFSAPFYKILFNSWTQKHWKNLKIIEIKHHFSYNPVSPNQWNIENSFFSLTEAHFPPVESLSLHLFIRHVDNVFSQLPNMRRTTGFTIPNVTEMFISNTDLDEFQDLMSSFNFPDLQYTHLGMEKLSHTRTAQNNFLNNVKSLEINFRAINQVLQGTSPKAFTNLPNVIRLSINMPEIQVPEKNSYYEYMRKLSAFYYIKQEKIFNHEFLGEVANTVFSNSDEAGINKLIESIINPFQDSFIDSSSKSLNQLCFLESFFYLIGENLTHVEHIFIICHSYRFFPSVHFEHSINRLKFLKQVLVYMEDNQISLQNNGIISNAISFYPYQQESFFNAAIDGGAKTRYISLIDVGSKQKYVFDSSDYLLLLYQNNDISKASFNGWY